MKISNLYYILAVFNVVVAVGIESPINGALGILCFIIGTAMGNTDGKA